MSSQILEPLWFALRIKPRHESAAAAALRSKGYQEFLPLYRSKRRWSDRYKEVELPLFPGYLFCQFDPNYRLPILTTPGVIRVLGSGKTLIPVDSKEIAAIQAIVSSGVNAQPWPFLKIGEIVRIDDGPLQGLEGVLINFKKPQRLVVSVSLLQRSVAVEIDRFSITPMRRAAQAASSVGHSPVLTA